MITIYAVIGYDTYENSEQIISLHLTEQEADRVAALHQGNKELYEALGVDTIMVAKYDAA